MERKAHVGRERDEPDAAYHQRRRQDCGRGKIHSFDGACQQQDHAVFGHYHSDRYRYHRSGGAFGHHVYPLDRQAHSQDIRGCGSNRTGRFFGFRADRAQIRRRDRRPLRRGQRYGKGSANHRADEKRLYLASFARAENSADGYQGLGGDHAAF